MNPIERLCQRRELGGHLEQRRDRLRRIALSWSRNRSVADDLVQETFEKALRHILHNCWMDHLRRERPCEDIETLSNTDEFATEQPLERMDIVRRVRAAIARLPLGQREVLSLVDLAGFSYAEVAMILEIPTGTVTSRISRARESLRDQLAPLTEQPRGNIVPISVAHA
jgi:RNA polymerase sigma-70 factor (ECF subfamily)